MCLQGLMECLCKRGVRLKSYWWVWEGVWGKGPYWRESGLVVVGRVGTLVLDCTHRLHYRYYSQCAFQHTGQELADKLKVCMASALVRYKAEQTNKSHEQAASDPGLDGLPERIVIYRDGVGDGQVGGL